MDLQDGDSKVQSSALPSRGDGVNYVLDHTCRATTNEPTHASDLHDKGKGDTASRYLGGSETILHNTISQLRTAVHGILNFLIKKSFCGHLLHF